MKIALKYLCLLSISFGLAAAVQADTDWGTDFEEAKAQAKESGKPILVNFTGSDWCGWCIKLHKEVFSKDAFKSYAKDNLILFEADFPRSKKLDEAVKLQNEKLAEKHEIRGFPTVLLLDAEGEVLAKTGYQRGGAKKYVEHLKELIAENTKEPAS